MLENPFTPSEIATQPNDFFGRNSELELLERSLAKGSVAIQGAIGIGKSSLLARVNMLMEGFNSTHRCQTIVAIGTRDVSNVDDAARMLLERFVRIDEAQRKIKLSLKSIFEFESTEVCRYFKEGRHLAALNEIIEQRVIPAAELLILGVDEADKCPVQIARLVRAVTTHVQHCGIKNVRFAIAGVSPFFRTMVDEDEGINRFFYKTLTVPPLPHDEAKELIRSKLKEVQMAAREGGQPVRIDPRVVGRIANLSGGHPHLLQLLGAHLIEHENQNPDDVLDWRDLVDALNTICYEDRARVYDSIIHILEIEGKLEPLRQLLSQASSKCPTRIERERALDTVSVETLDWLVSRNVLSLHSKDEYGLVDEFLRIRMFFDELRIEEDVAAREQMLIKDLRFYSIEEELHDHSDEDSDE